MGNTKDKTKLLLCLQIIAGLCIFGCSNNDDLPGTFPPLPVLNTQPNKFVDCEELQTWYKQRQALYKSYNQDDIYQPLYMTTNTPMVITQPPQVSDPGVDEADVASMDSQYLFSVSGNSIKILHRETLKEKGELTFSDLYNIKFFLEDEYLVVLGETEDGATDVRLFKKSDLDLVSTYKMPGYVTASAKVNKDLVIVTRSYVDSYLQSLPLDCSQILKPLIADFDFSLSFIHRISLEKLGALESLGQIGNHEHIFVTRNHVYLMRFGFAWLYGDLRLDDYPLYKSTVISKYKWLSDGGPEYLAAGSVEGWGPANARFKEDERNEFHIATTLRDQVRWSVLTTKNDLKELVDGSTPR